MEVVASTFWHLQHHHQRNHRLTTLIAVEVGVAIVVALGAYHRSVYSVMVIAIGQDAILLSSMTLVVRSARLQSGHLKGRILSVCSDFRIANYFSILQKSLLCIFISISFPKAPQLCTHLRGQNHRPNTCTAANRKSTGSTAAKRKRSVRCDDETPSIGGDQIRGHSSNYQNISSVAFGYHFIPNERG